MSASKWKEYPKYKISRIKWESETPTEWEIVRLRFLGKTYGGLTGKKGEDFSKENSPNLKPYIPYTNILNQTYISTNHFDYVSIDEGEKQNLAKAGDLFFLMSSESYQDLGKSSILIDDIDELYLNSFCKGFRVSESMIDPLFLNYQLQGHLHKQLISTEGKGFTRINLSQERLLDTPIFIPSISEQEQITNFLDTKIPTINHTIEQLEDTLSILEEKRSALITQAVTKGLNPNVEMKDSRIDWIGEIPKHWDIMKLKYLCETTKGKAFKSSEFTDSGFKIIRASDLKNNTVKFGGVYISEETASENINVKLHQRDILVSTVGSKPEVRNSAVGQVAKLPKELEGSFLNQNTVRLEAFESQISPEYLFNLLRNDLVRRFFDIHAHGTANQASLSLADILSFSFGMPPLIEQNEICKYISQKIQRIDSMSASINQQIETLNEYRIAMISAAVTGKIDIRESV